MVISCSLQAFSCFIVIIFFLLYGGLGMEAHSYEQIIKEEIDRNTGREEGPMKTHFYTCGY